MADDDWGINPRKDENPQPAQSNISEQKPIEEAKSNPPNNSQPPPSEKHEENENENKIAQPPNPQNEQQMAKLSSHIESTETCKSQIKKQNIDSEWENDQKPKVNDSWDAAAKNVNAQSNDFANTPGFNSGQGDWGGGGNDYRGRRRGGYRRGGFNDGGGYRGNGGFRDGGFRDGGFRGGDGGFRGGDGGFRGGDGGFRGEGGYNGYRGGGYRRDDGDSWNNRPYRPRNYGNNDSWGNGNNYYNDRKDENETEIEEISKNFEISPYKVRDFFKKYEKEPQPLRGVLVSNECVRDLVNSKKDTESNLIEWDKPEIKRHAKFIMTFKIDKCTAPSLHKTPKEKLECPCYHNNSDKRRLPLYCQKEQGKFMAYFNYKPLLCPNIEYCTSAVCMYSHNRIEVEYHPLMYKTDLCPFKSNEDEFECDSIGEKCPKAHSMKDIRKLVKILTEASQMLDMDYLNGEKAVNVTSLDPNIIIDNFDASNYKTVECSKKGCQGGIDCLYYHKMLFERRRSVNVYKYISKSCTSVFYDNAFHNPNKCSAGDKCQFCHTKNELYYHPDNYKKNKCIRKPCKYGIKCPDFHEEEKVEVSKFIDDIENEAKPSKENGKEKQKNEVLLSGINQQFGNLDENATQELEKLREAMQYMRCFKCSEYITDGFIKMVNKCKHVLCSKCKALQESDKPCIICNVKILSITTISLIKYAEVSSQFKNEIVKEDMI